MENTLQYGLSQLDMVNDGNGVTGLVPVNSIFKNESTGISPEEFLALEDAFKYEADYIYFRRFENRPSVAQVYIYDFTNDIEADEERLIELHKRLYNSGSVPMFFVFTKSKVTIFNCFEKPADGNKLKYKPLKTIELASKASRALSELAIEELQSFSGKSFDNGSFWENSKFSNSFNANNSAYEKLLSELKLALRDIVKERILPENIAKKLIVVSILIKYLEDRTDKNGDSVFPKDFFAQFMIGAEKFTDVLHDSIATLDLLDALARHFNGGVFEISDEERIIISETDISRFAQFLEGKLDGVQFVFWKLYSFNDLPVELISNIYEEFLGKQPGVVYTPPYLVNFLLDEAMPLSNDNTDFKILDPACGSGVFLVGAYRRLIQRWRKKNQWKLPSLAVLKKILIDNIYGIDKDSDATNLTVFSLSLALCDELTPIQIWKELRFDDLRKNNILSEDFFDVVLGRTSFNENDFDLIIGNPPFESVLSAPASVIERNVHRKRVIANLLKDGSKKDGTRIPLPDNQIALLFLEQCIPLCKSGGLVCLVQPSGPLLYNKSSAEFRRHLLLNYFVPQIVDFTHINRILFGERGDVATAAIFVKNEAAKEKGLLHITVRRSKIHKEKLYFELDNYDFHFVPRSLALNDPYIWKANFLGGSRYHQLISKLSNHRTIGEYISEKEEFSGWAMSEGYTLATKTDKQKLLGLQASGDAIKADDFEQKISAQFLTDKDHIPVKAFTIKGIDRNKISLLRDNYFHSKGKELVYNKPHILIKEIITNGELPTILLNEDLVFQRRIVGIHAPDEQYADLHKLANHISNNKLCGFYIAGTSGQYLINKSSAIYKQDIDNIPYPEDLSLLEINPSEQILIDDFNDYLLEFRRKGENSKAAKKDASQTILTKFGQVYCNALNTVYKSIKAHKPFETNTFICFPFYFGEKPNIEFPDSQHIEHHIAQLVEKDYGTSLRLIRMVRLYEQNIIYIIKPKKTRYWLRSIALRDSDETFSDLRKQGY
ncbi:N-6 DNA methylase [Hymenobacter sp. DH14]|uniref:site-specific DNA-methyltransferase (adenine-specific) n=1 Tax=Hymenobacter cyanobacteriorum TaxID=2926463 RepID=A0A9X1VHB6_9BACT|nr:N-6 DNA methylase [Hymenobacter cyanobacteriorum]MCI1188866.1 N-6 DNA methylase [Hymenobacter cyanobacteriorum]